MQYPDGMNEPESVSTRANLEALEALQSDASELERIEGLLDRFNVFEAIGFVTQEIMHSRFLAFLLDPKQNHGLDDLFLKGFLQKVSGITDGASLSRAFNSADDGNLGQTKVQTEVYTGDGRIDILLLNEVGRWAVIVENKVRTTEHSDQLGKYHRFVKQSHPDLQTVGVYLTPHGAAPERTEDREIYRPLGYTTICGVLDGVLGERGSALSPDVRVAVEHYAGMVRRYIVRDEEVSRLGREIYRKHQRAINRILEDLATASEATRKLVKGLIKETPKLEFGYFDDEGVRDWLVFDHRDWDVPALRVGERYHRAHRLLYFVIYSDFSGQLEVWLELGPGDTATRNRLLDMARRNPSAFAQAPDKTESYITLFERPLLRNELLAELPGEGREREIRRRWAAFLEEDLPRIEAALESETWIWESAGAAEGR